MSLNPAYCYLTVLNLRFLSYLLRLIVKELSVCWYTARSNMLFLDGRTGQRLRDAWNVYDVLHLTSIQCELIYRGMLPLISGAPHFPFIPVHVRWKGRQQGTDQELVIPQWKAYNIPRITAGFSILNCEFNHTEFQHLAIIEMLLAWCFFYDIAVITSNVTAPVSLSHFPYKFQFGPVLRCFRINWKPAVSVTAGQKKITYNRRMS